MTSDDKNIDSMPGKDGSDDGEAKRVFEKEGWMVYFEPAQARTLITKRWVKFSSFVGIYYMLQLTGCIGVVNFYSDVDRFTACTPGQAPLDAASVFDVPLLLFAIYHLIEWIKTTLLLSVACVGLPLMHVYYVLGLNTLYGCIAAIWTAIVVFSDEGSACAEVQMERGAWLKIEVLAFVVLLILYPGPIVPLAFCNKEDHDEILNKDSDDEDEDDD